VAQALEVQDKTETPCKCKPILTLLELVLVYTDYGYGHVDLVKHGHDLELPTDTVENLLNLLRETSLSQKEEAEENKPKQSFADRFDQVTFQELKDLKPHLPSDKYDQLKRSFERIIHVQFTNGMVGGICRRNISSRITIKVKTLHGTRPTHSIEVSIFDKLEVVIDKLLHLQQDEMLRYFSYKLLHCMSKLTTLDLKKSIHSLGLRNGTQLLLWG